MGQRIEVEGTTVVGDNVIYATDRGLSGMDGLGFDGIAETEGNDRFPAMLAARIFEADDAVGRVYVASNEIIVTRPGGWNDAAIAACAGVIERFLLYYGV